MKPDACHCGFFHFFCVGGSAPHISCTPFSQNEAEVRKTAARFSSSCSPSAFGTGPPFICHIPLVSLHDFFRDKHQIPSMCSARRLHTYMRSAPTKVQLVAPYMLNSFGNLIGSPNEDRLRTFHQNLLHGCQTKLTSLHKNKVEPTVLAAVCQLKQKNKMPSTRFRWCKHEFLLSQIYVCTYTWDIFSDILPAISFDILSDISSDILSDIFLRKHPKTDHAEKMKQSQALTYVCN